VGLSRRALLSSSTTLAASLLVACARRRPGRAGDARGAGDAAGAARPSRLRARPGRPDTDDRPVGLLPLGLGADRDGLVFVSERAQEGSLPLVVMLHGAGGNARGGLAPFVDRAEDAGVILLAPESRGRTWDVLIRGYGPDVAFLDRALEQTFRRYAIDVDRIAVEGFSDGASYALGIGLANGDLFREIIAFSPGYVPPHTGQGQPSVFISHGTDDNVLPIDRCSRRIVPALQGRGYAVRYHEFEGGHEVPAEIAENALTSFLG
jgi:phospholipase/carboxylesterase